MDFTEELPSEATLLLFSYFDAKTLCTLSQVSQNWLRFAEDHGLWRELALRRFPKPSSENYIYSWKVWYFEHLKLERNWRSGSCKVTTLEGHGGGVWKVLLDGHTIISGSYDNTVRGWNLFSRKCNFVIRRLTSSPFNHLQFTRGKVAGISTDKELTIWDVGTRKCLVCLQLEERPHALVFDDEHLVFGLRSGTLQVWSMRDDTTCVMELEGHDETVRVMEMDSRRIASAALDKTIRIWNRETGECEHVLNGHALSVACLAIKDNLLVSGSGDKTLRLWDLDTGNCLKVLEGHANTIFTCQLDDRKIVSGSGDKTIKVWSIATGECLATFQAHDGPVISCIFNESLIVSGSRDRTIKIFDFSTEDSIKSAGQPLNISSSPENGQQRRRRRGITSSNQPLRSLSSYSSSRFSWAKTVAVVFLPVVILLLSIFLVSFSFQS